VCVLKPIGIVLSSAKPHTLPTTHFQGVVNAAVGQTSPNGKENLKLAQKYFQLVGAAQSECDTVPGRQCMASCFFLLKQVRVCVCVCVYFYIYACIINFSIMRLPTHPIYSTHTHTHTQFNDVLIYLNSIKKYTRDDDDHFQWNYGIAQAKTGLYKEAADAFLAINSPKIRADYFYNAWLAKCLIYTGRARDAYELYLKMDNANAEESYSLLVLIANECYRVGAYSVCVWAI
jgi:intraflagellar transport protein 56